MPIENDWDLVAAVEQASRLIQNIHDYSQRTLRADAQIRFPRGVLRTAERYRTLISVTEAKIELCFNGFVVASGRTRTKPLVQAVLLIPMAAKL